MQQRPSRQGTVTDLSPSRSPEHSRLTDGKRREIIVEDKRPQLFSADVIHPLFIGCRSEREDRQRCVSPLVNSAEP